MLEKKESAEKLLEGLSNVKILDIDKYFKQQGVLVDIHVGRLRNKVTLPPNAFGVDIKDDDNLETFFDEYVKSGKVTYIPNSIEKRFQSIETNIRQKKKELSMGYDDKFMPIEVYKEFKKFIDEQKVKYFDVRDEVLAQWDVLIRNFKELLNDSLGLMNALYKKELIHDIYSKLPSKEQFEESCYIEPELMAFPTNENIDLFDEELSEEMRESIAKKSINTVYEILNNILSDAFKNVNLVMKYYVEKNDLTKKQLDVLKKLKNRLKTKNILKHPIVNDIIDYLDGIEKMHDIDDIQEQCEEINVLIYGFANSIDISLNVDLKKSVLKEKELKDLSLGLKF